MFKDWCELNGWYDNEPLPPPAEEGEKPIPAGPMWLAKGKAMAAFRSAIAGNAERKEPDVILKHLQDTSWQVKES